MALPAALLWPDKELCMALDAPMTSPQTELDHVIETADASCIKCGFCLPNARRTVRPASNLPHHGDASI